MTSRMTSKIDRCSYIPFDMTFLSPSFEIDTRIYCILIYNVKGEDVPILFSNHFTPNLLSGCLSGDAVVSSILLLCSYLYIHEHTAKLCGPR